MTWAIYTLGTAEQIDSRIDSMQMPDGYIDDAAGSLEQLRAAKSAAKELIASGALGTPEGFVVHVGGHANPGHAYAGNDVGGLPCTESVHVSVVQATIARLAERQHEIEGALA